MFLTFAPCHVHPPRCATRPSARCRPPCTKETAPGARPADII
ncbi:hypothetical protein TC41_2114 [Alicyclobacillus acidocaldarius subsp. acidocaldarius Tc-4-1]|uniref:Uncharacterized protein n=1 Tax=Alicyclobacillus acidocaldarius (strain Tc-4-1) TaxID=1048834 RepID=F8IF58_ALIAT|nr:hypothetical protein TC41_2114 [Alicyclobacillus acidocaldarius subsp. acidocaldarius Tc-4-1]